MVSNKLKEARCEWGMSVTELARRSEVSRVTIINIEKMESIPNIRTVLSICKVLNKSVEEIFFIDL